MIERFTDHAANERTYLAWIRTAIALVGLGFVIERFDIFLKSPLMAGSGISTGRAAAAIGLLLMMGGVIVLGVSTLRYVRFRRLIADDDRHDYASSGTEWLLMGVVFLVGILVVAYFVSQLEFFSTTLRPTPPPA